MLIVFSVIAFFYAYISYQDKEMTSFYIAVGIGILFIGLMVNNVIQVNKMKKNKKETSNND
jgi:1,4-dihydroxy-2-naphthoate octaprenyltransferase